MYFDSHFHYTSILAKDDSYRLPDDLVGIDVAINAGDIKERIEKIQSRNIFISSGSGPWVLDYKSFSSVDDELEKLNNEIELYNSDAIGEAGFDNHWSYGTKEAQLELFRGHIELSKKFDRALIIHTRDADEEIKSIMNKLGDRVIFHCFASDSELMRKALDRGAYISFSATLTYKSNEHIREALKLCPIDRLLYETDSPYLPPRKLRGQINTPEKTEITLDLIAELRNEDRDKIKENAIENLYRVLGRRESVAKRDITI